MGKRFTDSEKYRDKWYRKLHIRLKVGWDYLYHNCDCAGVIDLDEDRAEFEIGEEIPWDELIAAAGHRVEVLNCGKLWLTGFIDFQYGELSEDCRAHRPVFKSLEKHQISLGVPKGIQRVSSTLKDKDKEKDKEKDRGSAEGEVHRIESELLRKSAEDWLAYKRERRESYKPTGLKSFVSRVLTLAEEHGEPAVCSAIQRGMSNGWKGFEHDIGARGSPVASSPVRKPFDLEAWAKQDDQK